MFPGFHCCVLTEPPHSVAAGFGCLGHFESERAKTGLYAAAGSAISASASRSSLPGALPSGRGPTSKAPTSVS
jgi:hypothetical protein